jgi:DNA sulfur modification protein DndD
MKLIRLTVENFRQYYGKQRLEFAKDGQKRITIIQGVNGVGKTSLFTAINWCLYAEGAYNIGELLSKEAISRADVGEKVQAVVELVFLHNGTRYSIRRTLQGTKQDGGTIATEISSDLTMMRTRPDGNAEPVPNPIGTINSILPSNVRTYFLFDGEKIDNFAKPEAAKEVKRAVFLVLKLEVLENAKKHLETAAQDYRRELKSVSSGALRDLIERDEAARAESDKASKRRDELLQEVESAKRKISDIGQRLLEQQNAQVLQQQRERVERDLKQRRSELDAIVSSIRDTTTGAYAVAAQSAITSALQVLDEKRERGEIPSSIRKQFVQDLLARMSCICGRDFENGSSEHKRLQALVESSMPSSLEDDVFATSAALHTCNERTEHLLLDLDAAMKRRTELVEIINNLEAELDDVGRQLKGSPLEEISRLEKQRQDFLADIESYNGEIYSLAAQLTELSKETTNLEAEITQARKKEARERLLSDKLDLAQHAADAIGKVYEAFANEIRLKIEAKTKEIFKKLVWKDSHFQDVQVSPEFNLEVIDRWGMPARPELSAGERQVLSLSFITAMSRISEDEAPLIMDTPFGRLSSKPRNNITEHLPDLADQLVLFVTDEELRDEARKNLEPRIGAEYRLEFNTQTSCTEIVEVTR